MRSLLKTTTFCSAILCSHLASAENNSANTTDQWQWTVAPYVWALNMDGSLQIANNSAKVSENFGDILNDLQWGGMLWLEAHKGKVGAFLNILYASLSQSDSSNGLTLKNNFGLFTPGISYDWFIKQLNQNSQLTLSPYVGFRYTLNDAQLSGTGISLSNNHGWADPIIGAKLNYGITQAFSAIFAADFGGTTNTDYSYNLQALLGYTPQKFKDLTLYAGYRLLDQYYISGNGSSLFAWKMQLKGPILGLAFIF